MKRFRYFKCKNKHCKHIYYIEKNSDDMITTQCPKCSTYNKEKEFPMWKWKIKRFVYKVDRKFNLEKNIHLIRIIYFILGAIATIFVGFGIKIILLPLIILVIFMFIIEFSYSLYI